MHEGLRVDVLVVLGEVEPAFQRLIDDPAVVASGQAQLRLHRRAEQGPAELVEALALHHNAGRWPLKGLHIGDRKPHVLETQRLQRLEAEHVADDRGGEIGDRARLEQVEVVGDIGEVLPFGAWHGINAIALGAILFRRGQPIGPHHRPSRGRRFARHRRRGLYRIDALLWRDPEAGDDVGVPRLVVGLPVAHSAIFHHAGSVAVLALDGLRLLDVHGLPPPRPKFRRADRRGGFTALHR